MSQQRASSNSQNNPESQIGKNLSKRTHTFALEPDHFSHPSTSSSVGLSTSNFIFFRIPHTSLKSLVAFISFICAMEVMPMAFSTGMSSSRTPARRKSSSDAPADD